MFLIRITGHRLAWILISAAMFLMAWRRIVSFVSVIAAGKKFAFEVSELIALVISCLMLSGVLFITGYFRSIYSAETARKKAEAALRISEEHYRRIVDAINEGVWLFDADGKATYANKRMGDMLGYAASEVIGRPLMDFVDEQWHPLVRKCFERCVQGGTEQRDFQLRRKDGSYVWTVCSASPILGQKKEFLRSLIVVADISDRKRAEEGLERKLRDLEIFHKAAMDREQKMIELKEKLNELEERLKIQSHRSGRG